MSRSATLPPIRVTPETKAGVEAVLREGESLTQFIEGAVRREAEFRRVQSDFAARCDASLARYERTGRSVPADVVLSTLEAKVAARVKKLRG